MNILIQQVDQLPAQIQDLAAVAEKEGFQFIQRLIDEYQQGKNKFNRQGEFLLVAFDGDKLIACGGLNIQMSEDSETNQKPETQYKIGRVRRFYVLPEYRKSGIGKRLLQDLEKKAKSHFSALCLNSEKDAAPFYQKQNYVFVENHPNYNYFKYLI
ncbi:GNAT family N-acetyltransferase [Acinetobacter bereziniae]|uniref:GNAT family N-acetyltransferase n=1 Tax=Acinetobacter bereziniae TaxID=106648 RepID=UPI003016644E